MRNDFALINISVIYELPSHNEQSRPSYGQFPVQCRKASTTIEPKITIIHPFPPFKVCGHWGDLVSNRLPRLHDFSAKLSDGNIYYLKYPAGDSKGRVVDVFLIRPPGIEPR